MSFNLYYSTVSPVTKEDYLGKEEGVTSPYTVTGLTNGTTYYFAVSEVVNTIESDLSTEVSATPNGSSEDTIYLGIYSVAVT